MLLEIDGGDPGAWHEHADYPIGHAKHMVAEYINEKGEWDCPDHVANHLWDCAVLTLVAHEILGVAFWDRPDKPMPPGGSGRKVRSKGV